MSALLGALGLTVFVAALVYAASEADKLNRR